MSGQLGITRYRLCPMSRDDAAHSVALRWIANPLLDASRDLLDRFPALWIFDDTYPDYLQSYLRALRKEDEEGAIKAVRSYFKRVDAVILDTLKAMLPQQQPQRSESRPTRREGK